MRDLIAETKNDLLEFIDNLNITDGETGNYDIILDLVNNADNALFTKIIEEIKNGNLVFADFKGWFGTNEFLNESIESQEKIYLEHKLLDEYKQEKDQKLYEYAIANGITNVNDIDVINRNDPKFKYFLTTYQKKNGTTVEYSVTDVEKENILFSLMDDSAQHTPIEDIYRNRMITKILSSTSSDFTDSMLMSIHDYIVPVDFDKILLTSYDLNYAKNNHLTEDDMRKLKSFAAFLSTYYE